MAVQKLLLLILVCIIRTISSSPVCGVPVINGRIVGGTDAVDGEWPWQVVVYYGGDFTCGGSLINEQWVLSAAHCFRYPSSPWYYLIYLGMYKLGGSNPHGIGAGVEKIIKHPNYYSTGDRGDIALVKLKYSVSFTSYILPICIPPASHTFETGMECWVTGWGTRSSGGSLPTINTLQEVMTPLIDYKQCDQMYHIDSSVSNYTTIVQEEKICSGYAEGGKDSCQGDSGGPLVCEVDGAWIQAGIVSWGKGCALKNRPGVNTLVPAYQSWIQSYIPDMTFGSVTIPPPLSTLSTVSPSTSLSSPAVCGVPVISGRIVGGTDAVDGQWPWQVVIYYKGDFTCGGSLITEQWVLSAAHCIDYPSRPWNYLIYLGMYELGGSNPHGIGAGVEQIIKHPNYYSTGDRGDIALVKLEYSVSFTSYILPICLPPASHTFETGMECWVTGWGTRSSGGSLPTINTLQEVMTPLINYKQCDQMYHIDSSVSSYTTIVQAEKICSGYVEGGKDSCQGDSGGPLVCKVDGAWIQAGIVSWGEGCALRNRPGVYTLVPAYQSWIQSYIPGMTFSSVTIPPPLSKLSTLSTLSTVSPSTSLLSSPVCGVPQISGRIVGGTDAVDGEWPWQVAVYYGRDFTCGGSLINEQWVLSAAHCFNSPSSPWNYVIYLGIYKLGGSNPHRIGVEVEEIIKHPNYYSTGDRGDIALVKLKSSVSFTNYILPICLPSASVTFASGMECWVTGWGTRSSGESLPSINTLQEVMTPLIDYKQCDQMYHIDSSVSSYTTIVQEEKICSGYTEGGKDSCQGDSGGPLVCKVNGAWIQAGIVSWGIGCALPNLPGVYTLVPAYQLWIQSYIPDMTFSSVTIPPPLSAVSPSTSLSSPAVCGVPVISGRIVGGADVVDGEWPWQVAVYYGDDFKCGGSLINEQWVLSAAHCIDYPSSPWNYMIYLGMYKLGGSNPHGIGDEVEEIIKHPNYYSIGDRGDIALVKLKYSVSFTNYILPICLPPASLTFASGMECWVTGWGTRSSGGSLPAINTLQEVMTPLIDYKQCDQMYHIDSSVSNYTTIVQEEKICSGYTEGGKDSCQGDSGGPLVCKMNGVWIQVGVTSWGEECAKPYRPGVYSLVPAYLSWIRTYIPNMTFSSAARFTSTPWKIVFFCILNFIRVF